MEGQTFCDDKLEINRFKGASCICMTEIFSFIDRERHRFLISCFIPSLTSN